MRTLLLALWITLSLGAVGIAGNEETDPRGLAKVVAPFVDNQTVAVFHVDLATFDALETVDLLAEFLHMDPADRDRLQADVAPISVVAQTLSADAHADVFAVVSVSDLASLPLFFVSPLDPGAVSPPIAVELRRALAGQFRAEVATEEIAGALVTGSTRTIERLKQKSAVERPEIAAAFAAAGETAAQILIVPTPDARRAIELLMPKLPESLGGGRTSQITRHLKWAAVGVNLPPGDTCVRVVVEAENSTSAESLVDSFSALIKGLEDRRVDGKDAVELDNLTARLAPQADGARLTVEVFPESGEAAKFGVLLSPLLKVARGALPVKGP